MEMTKLILAAVIQVGTASLDNMPLYSTTEQEEAVVGSRHVYRIERDPATERTWIVGSDYEKRECAVVPIEYYEILTSRFEKVWTSMNATEDGRMKLHGKRMSTSVTNNVSTTVYSDGFVHRQPLVVKTARNIAEFRGIKKTIPRVAAKVKENISERHKKMRDEIARRNKGEPKTVNVEHDAITGKDIVK